MRKRRDVTENVFNGPVYNPKASGELEEIRFVMF